MSTDRKVTREEWLSARGGIRLSAARYLVLMEVWHAGGHAGASVNPTVLYPDQTPRDRGRRQAFQALADLGLLQPAGDPGTWTMDRRAAVCAFKATRF